MAESKKVAATRKPTGQELDRQYDDQHVAHEADSYPTPREARQEREEQLHEYLEDLKDPD